MFDVARVLYVRAATQVDERSVRVYVRDDFVADRVKSSRRSSLSGSSTNSFFASSLGYFRTHKWQLVRASPCFISIFKSLEIFWRERRWHFEVVVEAVVDGGTEADLGIGTQTPNGSGQARVQRNGA